MPLVLIISNYQKQKNFAGSKTKINHGLHGVKRKMHGLLFPCLSVFSVVTKNIQLNVYQTLKYQQRRAPGTTRGFIEYLSLLKRYRKKTYFLNANLYFRYKFASPKKLRKTFKLE